MTSIQILSSHTYILTIGHTGNLLQPVPIVVDSTREDEHGGGAKGYTGKGCLRPAAMAIGLG